MSETETRPQGSGTYDSNDPRSWDLHAASGSNGCRILHIAVRSPRPIHRLAGHTAGYSWELNDRSC